MKKRIPLRIMLVLSMALLLFFFCIYCPLLLSMEIYGVIDAETSEELDHLMILKCTYFEVHGFLFFSALLLDFILSFSEKPEKSKVYSRLEWIVTVVSICLFLSYVMGSIIIDKVNNLIFSSYWIFYGAGLIFLIIQIITFFGLKNIFRTLELKDTIDHTI